MKWTTIKLGKLCSVVTKGTTPRTLGKKYVSTGIPFLRAENLQGGSVILDQGTLFIDEDTNNLLSRSIIRPGDVLVSIAGTIGRCAIVPDDAQIMNCNQAVAITRISGPLDRRYLLHWLDTADAQRQMAGAKVTQTISNLSLTQIKNLNVPLPPIREQQRIVEILDQADELRKKRAEADTKAEKFLPALFYKMFGDPLLPIKQDDTLKLSDCKIDVQNGFACGKKDVPTGIPHLRMNNIDDGGVLNLDLIRTVPRENDREKYRLQDGDVLFMSTNSEDKIGKACVFYPPSDENFLFSNHLTRIRLKGSNLTSEYLASYLHLLWEKGYYPNIAKRWVNQASISHQALCNIKIAVPKKALVEAFTLATMKVLELQKRLKNSRQQIDTLFSTLLYRAFSGDLTAKWREAHMKELLAEMEEQAEILKDSPKTN